MDNLAVKIPYYEDSNFCFSNFSAHKVVFNGHTYPTAEHAYHAQKFDDEVIVEEIKSAPSPLSALQIARTHKEERKCGWDDIKVEILYEVMKAKVEQHDEVRESLINTGGAEIVEASPNKFWGNGLDGSGQNQCGKLLMRIRDEIQAVQ